MPLLANGEVVGDFIFMVAILLLVGLFYLLANLPGWIGALGGSLGLWSWMPSDQQYQRVADAMGYLDTRASDLSTQGREELKEAGFAVRRSKEARGFRAQWELQEAVTHCSNAVLGCSRELVLEVNRLLGLSEAR